jgi:hypothetical protein
MVSTVRWSCIGRADQTAAFVPARMCEAAAAPSVRKMDKFAIAFWLHVNEHHAPRCSVLHRAAHRFRDHPCLPCTINNADQGQTTGKWNRVCARFGLSLTKVLLPRCLTVAPLYLGYPLPSVTKMLKKDLTVWEHLKTIQSDGGKARWAKLTPEERSAQARKIVEVRWAKKRAAEVVPKITSPAKPLKHAKKAPKNK